MLNQSEQELGKVLSTPGELAEALKLAMLTAEPELDIKKLKYVLYVRKSTSGEERQERSIEDQIADCVEMQIKKYDLNVVATVQERESAKTPGIRPKFKQMLEDIQKGKYNGVLAWHPDRLARNMKDAGEIIYLLEENIIKDLRFATFTFENSPMGKMLLGMSFVLSKQYSDHLREQVTRGQRRSVQEGLSLHVPKQGYAKDINKRFKPDTFNNNWSLIKKAFEMKLRGERHEEIIEFLNEKKYTRAPAIGRERNMNYRVTKNTLTQLFSDPIYAGVYKFGNQFADITEVYTDFEPMISVEDYCKINNFTFNGIEFVTQKPTGQPRVKEKLLRGIIKCAECDCDMVSGTTTKTDRKGQKEFRYLFRCNNPACSVYGKSFRSKVALEFIYDYFAKVDFTAKPFYEQLLKEKEATVESLRASLDSKLRSLRQSKFERTKTYERTKAIIREQDPVMMKHYSGDLDSIEADIKRIDEQIAETKVQIDNVNDAIPTYEKYFELSKNLLPVLKNTRDMKLKDGIIRKYFLNLELKSKKIGERVDGKPIFEWFVSDCKVTPEYEKLLSFCVGRGWQT